MLEVMYIILSKIVWLVGSTKMNVLYRLIKSINSLCALPKFFTQNRYSPIIAVYSTSVVRDTTICAHCMFEKQFNALIMTNTYMYNVRLLTICFYQ